MVHGGHEVAKVSRCLIETQITGISLREYFAPRRSLKLQGSLACSPARNVPPALIIFSHSKHHRSNANHCICQSRAVSLSMEPQSHGKPLAQIVLPVMNLLWMTRMAPRLSSRLQ